MTQDRKALYKALSSHDARFDGVFYVGVTSTGIYCRPICPAKTPKETNCRFYDSAQEAEQARFRPCLRCRPELAPGNAPVDDAQRIARLIVQRLEEGTIESDAGLETIAKQFALSSRQIRRIVRQELGVSPIQLLLTRRLLLAKQLLTETTLPVTEIAFASGFSSLRRFNDAFGSRYGLAPTRLRKNVAADVNAFHGPETSTLQLVFRPPFDWAGVLAFLKGRELKGVEWIGEDFYARTVHLNDSRGWIRVTQAQQKNTLLLEFSHSLTPVLPALLRRARALFDLDARPDLIVRQLGRDKILGPMVKANSRHAGAGRLQWVRDGRARHHRSAGHGESRHHRFLPVRRGIWRDLRNALSATQSTDPHGGRVARASVDDIARLGIVSSRSRSIIALAQAQASDELCLDGGAHSDPDETIRRLAELPGIGQWTAHYIAMRALRWPDAFPKNDIAIRNNLGGISAKRIEEMSQAWRPWRSYAVLHIWKNPIGA